MEMVIATQNTMVSLNGMTVKRTQKIAERTEDVMMGAIKAQMIDIDGTYEVLFHGKALNHCVNQANAWAEKHNCVLKAMSISQR